MHQISVGQHGHILLSAFKCPFRFNINLPSQQTLRLIVRGLNQLPLKYGPWDFLRTYNTSIHKNNKT